MSDLQAALYARVSSEQQSQAQTIQSQATRSRADRSIVYTSTPRIGSPASTPTKCC